MMIFDQNGQIVTKHNRSYGANQFALFWTKRAAYRPKTYMASGLQAIWLIFKQKDWVVDPKKK